MGGLPDPISAGFMSKEPQLPGFGSTSNVGTAGSRGRSTILSAEKEVANDT